MTSYNRLLFLGILLTVVAFWYAKPIIWSASDSYNMVSVFHADERDQLGWVKEAYTNGNYNFPFNKYGHLYYDISLTVIHAVSLLTEITDQHIIITLRLISLLFGILSVVMLFQLARRFIDIHVAWLAAAMFILIPLNFWDLSFEAHPDIVQIFFLICSIYWCSFIPLRSNSKPFYLAILFAGLTFSVKYSGMFLIPLIFLVQIFHQCTRQVVIPYRFHSKGYLRNLRISLLIIGLLGFLTYWFLTTENVSQWFLDSPIESERNIHFINTLQQAGLIAGAAVLLFVIFQPVWHYLEANTPLTYNIRQFSYKAGISIAIFSLVFVITSPYLLVDFEFLRGLLQTSEIVSRGHLYLQNPGVTGWLTTLKTDSLLDTITFWFAILGMILSFIQLFVKGLKTRKAVLWISGLWILIYITMLALRIGHHPPRFLLPVVPFIILLSAYSILSVYRKLLDFIRPRKRNTFESIFILLVISGYFLANMSQFYQFRTETAAREENNVYLQAGQFLKEQYPNDIPILYDPYSYIPPEFTQATEIWNMNEEKIKDATTPELIVVNDKMSSRFRQESVADRFAGGEERYMKSYHFYQDIRQDTLTYTLVEDFGPVQIYRYNQSRLDSVGRE